jgi:hypothetical protein|tara:strand:+ start:2291 stop:2518 length:228 start_codon:yes stop_codon:yes gene_type:complete
MEVTINAWENDPANSFDVIIGVSRFRTNEDSMFTYPTGGCGSGFAYILQDGRKLDGCTWEVTEVHLHKEMLLKFH